MSRAVVVDGLLNVRDLGGLRRTNRELTPSGVFLRSESADHVTSRGWDQLRELGVRTVVDLRQPGERAKDVSVRPDWIRTIAVDLDGLENEAFWKDYWGNGLVATALYYSPHMAAMPERTGAALSAIVGAEPGGVLFHCAGGRDRTGMIAMLLLAAVGAEPAEIVDDYLETVRLGDARAARAGVPNGEPEIEALCAEHGTTTEGAFRAAMESLELEALLERAGLSGASLRALRSWRGAIVPGGGAE